MSGHSKWSQIKRQKQSADVRRGQVFSKLAKAIAVAVREGGSADPETNYKLRYAIDTARTFNMPKDNIARAIKQGRGVGTTAKLEGMVFEGFGPAGVAVVVEAVTDNKNRTISDVRKVFDKNGGNLAGVGSVLWNFEKKGQIVVKLNGISADQVLVKAADVGAEDLEVQDNSVWVYCQPDKLAKIKNDLQEAGLTIESAELAMKPKNIVKVEDVAKACQVLNLVDSLDNLDDVQKVYANFDIPDNILEGMQGS